MMNSLKFVYRWKSRDLRKIIMAILKSWFADSIKKINYVNDYSLVGNKVEKADEKLILINTQDSGKLIDFLSKNFPQMEEINM